jgi:GTP-binding protein EngB required for normal cell division
MERAIEIRSQCTHFRILVIGRANAGKTTLLKKVCETTDEPRIYDLNGKEVGFMLLILTKSYCFYSLD